MLVAVSSTVSASILGSFVFRVTSFTPPARAPVTPAAVHERLAGAPMRTARLGHVEVAITFVEFELLARSGAPRGQRESAALSSRFLRAGQANSASYIHHVLFAAGCAVCGVHMPVLHRRREVRRRGCLVKQSRGARGVVCCSSKSLSAVKVSAPSTPYPSTPV